MGLGDVYKRQFEVEATPVRRRLNRCLKDRANCRVRRRDGWYFTILRGSDEVLARQFAAWRTQPHRRISRPAPLTQTRISPWGSSSQSLLLDASSHFTMSYRHRPAVMPVRHGNEMEDHPTHRARRLIVQLPGNSRDLDHLVCSIPRSPNPSSLDADHS